MCKCSVVILAGGFGSRLRPVIGDQVPKPMAPISGKPLLEHQISVCQEHGFTNILLLLHHLPEVITGYFGDGSDFGVQLHFAIESTPRGTAGAIFDNLDKLTDPFIVIYGDTMLDVDLSEFWGAKHVSDDVLTLCHPNSHPFDSDLLQLSSDGLVERIFRPQRSGEQLYSNLANAALYVCSKSAFIETVPDDQDFDISSQLFPVLVERKKLIRGYRSVEYIKDMGTPERYAKVVNEFHKGVPERLSKRAQRVAVFLDRDGVINEANGYINGLEDFRILPGVFEAIKIMNEAGVLVIVVTNQPQIARGELDYSGLDDIHKKMQVELGLRGAYVDGTYYCPHHPDSGYEGERSELKRECKCRKPQPGMLIEAARQFNINLGASWMVGDHARDIEAGRNAGVRTCYIAQDGRPHLADLKGSDLLCAIKQILPKIEAEMSVIC